MSTSNTTLEVGRREELGKNASRRLRREQRVPAVIYGGGVDPIAIQVPQRAMQDLLRASGENAVFQLKLQGTDQTRNTMIKDIQYDALTGNLVHVDFQRIRLDELVHVKVPIEVIGTPTGVKNEGGILDFILREVEIECFPGDIPDQIECDVSGLQMNENIELGELPFPDNVTLLEDRDRVVAAVAPPRLVEEEEEEGEEEELLEAEGEEPEVIQKGKEDEEGEAETESGD